MARIEEDGGSWLRRPKLYKRVVEQHKKRNPCGYAVAQLVEALGHKPEGLDIYIYNGGSGERVPKNENNTTTSRHKMEASVEELTHSLGSRGNHIYMVHSGT